jgi:hypothetical protein
MPSVVGAGSVSCNVKAAMKNLASMICLTAGVVVSLYGGSYFLSVSQVGFGITGGSHVSVAPWYRYAPSWFDASLFYRPIHSLDRRHLRRSVWQDRAARDGELSGIVGPRRVLISIPATNSP